MAKSLLRRFGKVYFLGRRLFHFYMLSRKGKILFIMDDICRDEEGLFYFVDRMGGFIRVKGENISSFQIEDIINTHPQVAVSAAFPVPAEKGLEDDIVVYIVLAPGEDLSESGLRSWMEREMPKYMRPRHIRFIEALPQTPTHKVEKYKLKQMFLNEVRP